MRTPPLPTPARRLASIPAAEYVGVTPKTMRRCIAIGHITAYRVGPKFIRIDLAELDAMLSPVPADGVVTE